MGGKISPRLPTTISVAGSFGSGVMEKRPSASVRAELLCCTIEICRREASHRSRRAAR
jgi:hypothetical protein